MLLRLKKDTGVRYLRFNGIFSDRLFVAAADASEKNTTPVLTPRACMKRFPAMEAMTLCALDEGASDVFWLLFAEQAI